MPVINELTTFNTNPIRIKKSEWLLKVSNGEITANTKAIYLIEDDFIDPGSGSSIQAGEGIIYVAATGTISVDKDWLGNIIGTEIPVDAESVDGIGITDGQGSPGIVIINNQRKCNIGNEIVFHRDNEVASLYITDDGYIGAYLGFFGDLKGCAEEAIADESGNNIKSTYVKSITINNGNIIYTYGNNRDVTVPLPAGTSYTGGNGINITGSTITNTGVLAVSTSSTNGCISVNTNGNTNQVNICGLKSAAYTESSAYATANHKHDSIDSASKYASYAAYDTNKKSGANSLLRNIGFGIADASNANCPEGALYGTYSAS